MFTPALRGETRLRERRFCDRADRPSPEPKLRVRSPRPLSERSAKPGGRGRPGPAASSLQMSARRFRGGVQAGCRSGLNGESNVISSAVQAPFRALWAASRCKAATRLSSTGPRSCGSSCCDAGLMQGCVGSGSSSNRPSFYINVVTICMRSEADAGTVILLPAL